MPDGSYTRAGARKKTQVRSQQALFEQTSEAVQRAVQSKRTVFEPHRASSSDE